MKFRLIAIGILPFSVFFSGCLNENGRVSLSGTKNNQLANVQVTPKPTKSTTTTTGGSSSSNSSTSSTSGGGAGVNAVVPESTYTVTVNPFRMPMYDQKAATLNTLSVNVGGTNVTLLPNGPSNSVLCVPTSAAMVLEAVIQKISTVRAPFTFNNTRQTWLKNNFVGATFETKIRNLADRMKTNPHTNTINGFPAGTRWGDSSGTIGMRAVFPSVEHDLNCNASSNNNLDQPNCPPSVTSSFATLNLGAVSPDTLINAIGPNYGTGPGNNSALGLNYGHYMVKNHDSGENAFITFERNGGHVVAVKGYTATYRQVGAIRQLTGHVLMLHDPFGGYRANISLDTMGSSNALAILRRTNTIKSCDTCLAMASGFTYVQKVFDATASETNAAASPVPVATYLGRALPSPYATASGTVQAGGFAEGYVDANGRHIGTWFEIVEHYAGLSAPNR